MHENEIGTALIGAAIKVPTTIGPGLLESAYEACLVYELDQQQMRVRQQVTVPLKYENLVIDAAYRADLIIEDLVVVELKSVDTLLPVHRSQLLSYLRLGGFRLGYLLNFNVAHMRDGITRMVYGL